MGSFLGGMEPLVLRCCHFYGESQAKSAALRMKIKSRIEAQIVVKPPVIPTRRMLSAWLPEQAARPHGNGAARVLAGFEMARFPRDGRCTRFCREQRP